MSNSSTKKTDRINLAIKVSMAALVIVVLLLVGWYVSHRMHKLSNRLSCASNLKRAAASFSAYCANESDWQACVDSLQARQWKPLAPLMCPTTNAAYEHKLVIVRSDLTKPFSAANFVLLEPMSNLGVGGHAVFIDGHAQFLDAKDHAALLSSISEQPSFSE